MQAADLPDDASFASRQGARMRISGITGLVGPKALTQILRLAMFMGTRKADASNPLGKSRRQDTEMPKRRVPPLEQRHGHRGVAHLRVAVMEVLYAAKKAGECIGPAEISRRAGIFRAPGYAVKSGNDYIVGGVLNSLVKDRLLTKCTQANGKPGWELTDRAFARRDEEVAEVPDWGGDQRIIDAYRIKQWGFCPGCLAVLPERPDVDHIRSRARGGSDDAKNKQLLCPNCNRRRGAKPFDEFLAERLADGNEWTDYEP